MNVGFGPQLQTSFARIGQEPSSWKMSLDLFPAEDSPTFSGIWPTSGTMQNGVCFPAHNWELRITAREFSFLDTTRKNLHFIGPNHDQMMLWEEEYHLELEQATKEKIFWPTPTTSNENRGGTYGTEMSVSIQELVEKVAKFLPQFQRDYWPIPMTDNKNRGGPKALSMDQVVEKLSGHLPPTQSNGSESNRVRPNIEFLEWLMGFPSHWSAESTEPEFMPWEMQLAHLLPLWLGRPLKLEP